MTKTRRPLSLSRRGLIAAATIAPLASPGVLRGQAAGEVIVRTPGGVYDDVMRRHVYDPFTKETGIRVQPVAATVARLLAMFRANNVELDLIDTGDGPLVTLERMGALAPIAYDQWRWTKPDDIVREVRHEYRCANFIYATVLAYNRESFPNGTHPKSWAEFWDGAKFPGPRMLADMASGQPNLEFALIADGVPKDQLYPLDIDRAFRSLSRVKPHIRKFWDTGALSAQMLSDKEVVLGSVWNGRVQTIIDRGAPLGIEWNQHMIQTQALAVFKGARNGANAQKLIDFMLRPESQAGYARELIYGPTNVKAFDLLPADQLARMPGSPNSRESGFFNNVPWWEDNRDRVNRAWSRWILG